MEGNDTLFQWAAAIIASLLGLLWNDNRTKIRDLDIRQKEHEALFSAYRENSAGRFVSQEDFQRNMDRFELKFDKFSNTVETKLDNISDKLNRKQDRQ